jgi:hypothetical protein
MRASIKNAVNVSSREFFQVFLVTYLLLTLAETYREGFVSNFFNINYLLAVVLVSGVAMVLTETEQKAVKFRKLAARAVIVLTSRQERRQMIQQKRQAMAARQEQLYRQRVMDIRAVSTAMHVPKRYQPAPPVRRPINTTRQKRRIDGFL